jgi:hypothetical protein
MDAIDPSGLEDPDFPRKKPGKVSDDDLEALRLYVEELNSGKQYDPPPPSPPPITYVPGLIGGSIHLNDPYFAGSPFGTPVIVCHGVCGQGVVGPPNSFRFPNGPDQLALYQGIRDVTGHLVVIAGDLIAAEMLLPVAQVSANTASLTARAEQVHSVLDPIAAQNRTTAVLKTSAGDIIGGGVRDLTPAQRMLQQPGEILAKLPGAHAEVTVMQEAAARGLAPRAIGTTRDFCDDCMKELIEAGATITGKRTAIWP